MLHLGLAGNILCAIGGTPRLSSTIPEFPAVLFDTKLNLTMKPATKETIGLFVAIEAPIVKHEPYSGIPEVLSTYKSIGDFYDGLQICRVTILISIALVFGFTSKPFHF